MQVSRLRLRLLETGSPMYVIAGYAGIAPTRISEYCQGKREMPQHHVISLCQVLKCNPDDITGWDETDYERSR